MKKYAVLFITAAAAIVLDCTVLAEWNLSGVRPWLLLSVSLAACAALNPQSGILTALFGGLIIDAVSNFYVGLTAACYLISVGALWLLIRKNHPKPLILWTYTALTAALWIPVEWFYSYLAGAHFGAVGTILTKALPSAVLTGLFVLPAAALLENAKKSHRDKI